MNKMMRFCKMGCMVLLFLAILVLGTRDAQQATGKSIGWLPATPIPYPLASHMVKCVDDSDHFYLLAGALDSIPTPTNALLRYTISTGFWEALPVMPDVREGLMAACYQGKIFAAGGWHYVGGYAIATKTLYIYDIDAGLWTAGTPLADVIDFGAMGAWDGKLYVMGGTRTHYPLVPVNRVDVYDIASGQWTAGGGAPMPFAASHFGFGAQAGPYIYVVGGIGNPYPTHVNRTQRYNMATNVWELGPNFTSARANHTVAVTGAHLYAISGDLEGGGDYEPIGLVESLDISTWPTGPWQDLQDPLPTPVIQGASTCSEVLTGGEIWAVGGISAGIIMIDDNSYRPTEPCVRFGVDLPEPMVGEGVRGANVEYQITITNTGSVTDYYTLEITSTWGFSAPAQDLGPIEPGESVQFAVTVEVPMDADLGDQGTTEIAAISIGNPTEKDSVTITTTTVFHQFFVPLVMKN